MSKNKSLFISVAIAAAILLTAMSVLAAAGDLALSTATASQTGAPGATVTYTVNVSNRSDYTTVATLTLTAAFPWAQMPAALTLGPNVTETAPVVVTIPATAAAGSSVFTVTASGIQQPGGTAVLPADVTPLALTINVAEEGYVIFLPAIMKAAQ